MNLMIMTLLNYYYNECGQWSGLSDKEIWAVCLSGLFLRHAEKIFCHWLRVKVFFPPLFLTVLTPCELSFYPISTTQPTRLLFNELQHVWRPLLLFWLTVMGGIWQSTWWQKEPQQWTQTKKTSPENGSIYYRVYIHISILITRLYGS